MANDPNAIKLENDVMSVRVSPAGAELQSVVKDGTERIWEADPVVWDRHAPLLFPIVGRLIDGWYALNGEQVDAPMHGFCRDRAFEVEPLGETGVRFTTADDAETREVFPFNFDLAIEYELDGGTLIKRHIVKNTGENPMPFEIGGHEAYALRLDDGTPDDSWYVQFDDLENLELFGMDEDGILFVPKKSLALEGGRLTCFPEDVELDTMVVEDVPGNRVTLGSEKSPRKVTVEFPDFPYLGMWTMPAADFPEGAPTYLCIEPWSALPDTHFSPRELGERAGVLTLAPGEETTLTYKMTFEG